MPEKGFTLIMDDFPVLGSVNSESNTRRGDYLQHSSFACLGCSMSNSNLSFCLVPYEYME